MSHTNFIRIYYTLLIQNIYFWTCAVTRLKIYLYINKDKQNSPSMDTKFLYERKQEKFRRKKLPNRCIELSACSLHLY